LDQQREGGGKMSREEAIADLRDLADALEAEWGTVDEMVRLLSGIVAACPWEFDAGGSPEFWLLMRRARTLVQTLKGQGHAG
jgi:hypothetical protein